MKFRIGQKVRFLHESGEGVITQLIDKNHVEVDLGDDFPIDAHVSELIPIDGAEFTFLSEDDTESKSETTTIRQLGTQILDLSLVTVRSGESNQAFYLINPEPADILFTCFGKINRKYQGLAAGQVESGDVYALFKLSEEQLYHTKSFYFQVLTFVQGKGHPHTPYLKELAWSKNQLKTPPVRIAALDQQGWIFSLREDKQKIDVSSIEESELREILKSEEKIVRRTVEVDLHIEELVKYPHELAPSEMLNIQMAHFNRIMSEAILGNYSQLIVIHGVGEGKLKAAVKALLKHFPQVKSSGPADPVRYGNGATQIIFK